MVNYYTRNHTNQFILANLGKEVPPSSSSEIQGTTRMICDLTPSELLGMYPNLVEDFDLEDNKKRIIETSLLSSNRLSPL